MKRMFFYPLVLVACAIVVGIIGLAMTCEKCRAQGASRFARH